MQVQRLVRSAQQCRRGVRYVRRETIKANYLKLFASMQGSTGMIAREIAMTCG